MSTSIRQGLHDAAPVFWLPGPLASDVGAQVLHALPLGLSGWMLFSLACLTPFFVARKAAGSAFVPFSILTYAASLVSLRRGSIRQAGLVHLWGVRVLATLLLFNGGINSLALIFYLALPISAACFLDDSAMLSVMDGLETATRIRMRNEGADVKIVALTGSALSEQRNQALATGLDDLIRKPSTDELFDLHDTHLHVEYAYEQSEATTSQQSPEALRRESAAVLSGQLRAELRDASVCLDVPRVNELVGRITVLHAKLGSTLRSYAEGFAYTKMLQAIEPSESDSREES